MTDKVARYDDNEESSDTEESSFDLASLFIECIPQGLTAMPSVMSSEQLADWLIQSNARDGYGELDWNDIRDIVGNADIWELHDVNVEKLDGFVLEPIGQPRKNPIVVTEDNGIFDVLDGRHRVPEAKWRGDKTIRAYIGK